MLRLFKRNKIRLTSLARIALYASKQASALLHFKASSDAVDIYGSAMVFKLNFFVIEFAFLGNKYAIYEAQNKGVN